MPCIACKDYSGSITQNESSHRMHAMTLPGHLSLMVAASLSFACHVCDMRLRYVAATCFHTWLVCSDLKRDKEGLKEYTDFLATLEQKKADLQKRIDASNAWVENFEKNDSSGSVEQQYKGLMDKVQLIYDGAKEFHAKGIDMLIKEVRYEPRG